MSIYNLTHVEQKIYNRIADAMNSLQLQAQLPSASAEEILLILNKVISENRNGFLYKPGSVKVSNSITGTTLHMEMCPEARNRITFCSQIEFEVDEIISTALKKHTIYDEILMVYTYFVKHFRYAQSHIENEKYHMTASPFLYREAVCEGFAFAFAHIMNRLDIPCGIITGVSALNGSNGSHAWNIVCLDNRYYHVDVTWDICMKEKGGHLFDYLFLDDCLVSRDHRWNDSSIPYCTDPSKEFYAKERLICNNRTEAISLLEKQIRLRKKVVGFRYSGDYADTFFHSDLLSKILNTAMRQSKCVYSRVNYGYNSDVGTAYFKIDY